MSTNEKKPRRTFDQDFIDGAVKLVTQEGYSLAAAAKAVNVPYTTLRQWCQKQSAQSSPTSDKSWPRGMRCTGHSSQAKVYLPASA